MRLARSHMPSRLCPARGAARFRACERVQIDTPTLALTLTCLVALFVGLAPRSSARASDDLSAVVQHLRARGASEVVEVNRGFLFEGQSTAHEQKLSHAGCVAYLALGLGEVRDVDLGLYTRAGQLIAEDVAIAPYAYARVCGAAGLQLYATATLYAGRGQLVLLRIEHAPRELGRLPENLPLAVSPGGRLEELRSVGAAADEASAEAALLQEERSHLALGYTVVGPPSAFELRAGSARGHLPLRGGACFRISVLVPLSRGVALEIEGPGEKRWSTRSAVDDRAAVALCAPGDGAYAVRIQARPLRGLAFVRAYEHRGVDPARARVLGDASALAIAEAEHVAHARGLSLTSLGDAWVEGSAPLVWPLHVENRGCYALAVVSDVGAAGVDVRLTDANGVLIAHNEGRRGVPMIFACPREAGSVRLMLKARGPDLPVSVWLGRHVEAGGPAVEPSVETGGPVGEQGAAMSESRAKAVSSAGEQSGAEP